MWLLSKFNWHMCFDNICTAAAIVKCIFRYIYTPEYTKGVDFIKAKIICDDDKSKRIAQLGIYQLRRLLGVYWVFMKWTGTRPSALSDCTFLMNNTSLSTNLFPVKSRTRQSVSFSLEVGPLRTKDIHFYSCGTTTWDFLWAAL